MSGDRKQAAEKGRHRSRILDSAVDNHSLPACCAASRFSSAGATKGETRDSESEMVRHRAFQLCARNAKAANFKLALGLRLDVVRGIPKSRRSGP